VDLSGRFDFWRMLLHTRAITPPRVLRRYWPRAANLPSEGWWVLVLIAALAAGAALQLGVRDRAPRSVAINQTAPVAQPGPAKSAPSW
jgi:hypothetical protein